MAKAHFRISNLLTRNYIIPTSEHIQNKDDLPLLGEHYHVGAKLARIPPSQDTSRYYETEINTYGSWGVTLKLSLSQKLTRLPNLWLRDNCFCKKCVNPDTMQKTFNIFSIPENIIPNEVVTEREGLKITWPDSDDLHLSFYPWSWIIKKTVPNDSADMLNFQPKTDFYALWGSEIEYGEPSICYDEIMTSEIGVGKWTDLIRKYGFCYIENCPVDPEETKRLIEKIAFIRKTHYGGFYDFTSDLTMRDTAYTTLALQLHTDTTYFTDPAGIQMLHLLSHTNGSGGATLLVDGFKAARTLKLEFPQKYKVLCSKPVPARAVGNEGITVKPSRVFPVLNLRESALGEDEPELYQIRWNNDDRGAFPLGNKINDTIEEWYSAARCFQSIINMSTMQYKTQLKPGRPLIFDNWRVLHGRTAFTGNRRMCGAYINHDDYVSRWLNTNYSRKQILDEIL